MSIGKLVGEKYRLVRQIGGGAMGVVWAAVNELTSREVALKLLIHSSDNHRYRLFREAQACGALSHRNIVDILDVGYTESGDPFLVMQLLSGETLGELLVRQRRLDPPVAAQIGRDVARALIAAHAASIIHRDLKPANIFLHREVGAEGPIVKVLDFGVSKNLSAKAVMATVSGGVVGSPAYMGPEQIRGDASIDERADIWSLGVVLFEMLTGTLPFQGNSEEVVRKIFLGPVPFVSHYVRNVAPDLVDVVSRCLERSRDRRVSSAEELARLLDRHASSGMIPRASVDPVRYSTPLPPPSVRTPPSSRPEGALTERSSQTWEVPEANESDIVTIPLDLGLIEKHWQQRERERQRAQSRAARDGGAQPPGDSGDPAPKSAVAPPVSALRGAGMAPAGAQGEIRPDPPRGGIPTPTTSSAALLQVPARKTTRIRREKISISDCDTSGFRSASRAQIAGILAALGAVLLVAGAGWYVGSAASVRAPAPPSMAKGALSELPRPIASVVAKEEVRPTGPAPVSSKDPRPPEPKVVLKPQVKAPPATATPQRFCSKLIRTTNCVPRPPVAFHDL